MLLHSPHYAAYFLILLLNYQIEEKNFSLAIIRGKVDADHTYFHISDTCIWDIFLNTKNTGSKLYLVNKEIILDTLLVISASGLTISMA